MAAVAKEEGGEGGGIDTGDGEHRRLVYPSPCRCQYRFPPEKGVGTLHALYRRCAWHTHFPAASLARVQGEEAYVGRREKKERNPFSLQAAFDRRTLF